MVEIRQTQDAGRAIEIAQLLPDHFNEAGLAAIRADTDAYGVVGAFLGKTMVGFATFREFNRAVIELKWLAVAPRYQGRGVGAALIEQGLATLAGSYRICRVKTLAETDPYEPFCCGLTDRRGRQKMTRAILHLPYPVHAH